MARRAVGELLSERPVPVPRRDMLILLISEIVTNAVIHPEAPAGAEVGLEVVVDDEQSRVVVVDEGKGFDHPPTPAGRESGGYGLMLLAMGASRWGTVRERGRFSVWFEVDHVADSRGDRDGRDEPAATTS
jgi:anti-sigma regulatory factor (Ser/Thr protein kinase)